MHTVTVRVSPSVGAGESGSCWRRHLSGRCHCTPLRQHSRSHCHILMELLQARVRAGRDRKKLCEEQVLAGGEGMSLSRVCSVTWWVLGVREMNRAGLPDVQRGPALYLVLCCRGFKFSVI